MLLVVGSTAALTTLAAALLSVSLLGYEIAALEHQGSQAMLLASSSLDALDAELVAGSVSLPAPGGVVVWTEVAPSSGVPAGYGSCAFEVQLSLPISGSGVPLQDASVPPARLLDVVAEGRCGLGLATLQARFALLADGSVRRLY